MSKLIQGEKKYCVEGLKQSNENCQTAKSVFNPKLKTCLWKTVRLKVS